jgi:hypothetical protein
MFADIHHFIHVSHHVPTYVSLTRLGNTINNVSDEYSELKAPPDTRSEVQFLSRQDINFSELFAFSHDASWAPEYSSKPSSPSALSVTSKCDRESVDFGEFPDHIIGDVSF